MNKEKNQPGYPDPMYGLVTLAPDSEYTIDRSERLSLPDLTREVFNKAGAVHRSVQSAFEKGILCDNSRYGIESGPKGSRTSYLVAEQPIAPMSTRTVIVEYHDKPDYPLDVRDKFVVNSGMPSPSRTPIERHLTLYPDDRLELEDRYPSGYEQGYDEQHIEIVSDRSGTPIIKRHRLYNKDQTHMDGSAAYAQSILRVAIPEIQYALDCANPTITDKQDWIQKTPVAPPIALSGALHKMFSDTLDRHGYINAMRRGQNMWENNTVVSVFEEIFTLRECIENNRSRYPQEIAEGMDIVLVDGINAACEAYWASDRMYTPQYLMEKAYDKDLTRVFETVKEWMEKLKGEKLSQSDHRRRVLNDQNNSHLRELGQFLKNK